MGQVGGSSYLHVLLSALDTMQRRRANDRLHGVGRIWEIHSIYANPGGVLKSQRPGPCTHGTTAVAVLGVKFSRVCDSHKTGSIEGGDALPYTRAGTLAGKLRRMVPGSTQYRLRALRLEAYPEPVGLPVAYGSSAVVWLFSNIVLSLWCFNFCPRVRVQYAPLSSRSAPPHSPQVYRI